MTKLRRLSLIYMWNAFVFLILLGLSSFATMMLYRSVTVVYWQFLLCIPFFITFEIKRRSGNVFLFFGLNIAILVAAVTASLLLIDFLPYRIFMIAYMVIVVGISVFTRLSYNSGEINAMFLVVAISINAILTFMANAFDVSAAEPTLIACSTLQFILYIAYTRVQKIDYALEIIESTSVQPIDKILGFNNLITIIFILLSSAAIFVAVFFHAESLIIYAGKALLRLIRFLASLTNSEIEPLEDIEMRELPSGPGFDPSMFGEPGKPFFLFVIFEKIFFFVMTAAIIVGIILGVCYLLYRVYTRFNDRLSENGDEKEFLLPEVFTEGTRDILGNLRDFFSGLSVAKDNNRKVRRIFYKKVSGHIARGAGISTKDTTRDITDKIKDKEDVSLLAGIYRKARYSNEVLTDKEVEACRSGEG